MPQPLDYGTPPTRSTARGAFWLLYVASALFGYPVIGTGTWKALSGHHPDQAGVALLFLGVGVTTSIVAICLAFLRRPFRSQFNAGVVAVACGLCSSLPGIAIAMML